MEASFMQNEHVSYCAMWVEIYFMPFFVLQRSPLSWWGSSSTIRKRLFRNPSGQARLWTRQQKRNSHIYINIYIYTYAPGLRASAPHPPPPTLPPTPTRRPPPGGGGGEARALAGGAAANARSSLATLTLHYSTLYYITLHYVTLCYITLHYITH